MAEKEFTIEYDADIEEPDYIDRRALMRRVAEEKNSRMTAMDLLMMFMEAPSCAVK